MNERRERILNPTDAEDVVIVGGSIYPEHAKAAAEAIGTKVGNISLTQFANSELSAEFDESVREKRVFVIQTDVAGIPVGLEGNISPWSVDSYSCIMQTAIIVDAAVRGSAREVTVIKPHFGYGRQDRKKTGREPVTAFLHIDILAEAGMKRLVTVDAHTPQTTSKHKLSDNLTGTELLINATSEIFDEEEINSSEVIFVAPDGGSLGLPQYFANSLGEWCNCDGKNTYSRR